MLLACCAVFVLGVVINHPYGGRGFMPIDQSILFDGGWRMLTGQVPIRDFATPNGIVPAAMQAAVFRVGGVSWTSYVVHADVLNGLFGVLVLLVLRSVGGSLVLSVSYAVASAVVFQPPFGTPFVDQASFFFSLVALWLALTSTGASTPLRRLAVALVPLALTLSVLSKQIPGVMIAPLVVAVCLTSAHDTGRVARLLGVAAAAVVVLLLVVAVVADVPLAGVVEHLWTLPSQVGMARLDASNARLWAFIVPQWALLTPATVLLGSAAVALHRSRAGHDRRATLVIGVVAVLVIAGAVLRPSPAQALVRGAPGPGAVLQHVNAAAGYTAVGTAAVWLAGRRRRRWSGDTSTPAIEAIVALAVALVVVCGAFVAMTLNQIENGVPFVFVALGLLHVAVLRTLHDYLDASNVLHDQPRRMWIAPVIGVLFAGITVVDVVTFDREVNGPRVVHDYRFDAVAATSTGLPAGFDVQLDGPFPYTAADLDRITTLVREADGDTVLFGDTTVIPALAGVESVSPMLWLDPGLVFPHPGAATFEPFDQRFAEVVGRPSTATVVVEQAANPWWSDTPSPADVSWRDARTWTGTRLSDFPQTLRAVDERLCSVDTAGPFTLVRLCPVRGLLREPVAPREEG